MDYIQTSAPSGNLNDADDPPERSSIDSRLRSGPETQAEDVQRIPTGIVELDCELGGGARAGKLYMVCAYTGYGKSSFAVHLSAVATEFGRKVLYFHSEMSARDDYYPRLIAWKLGVPYNRISRSTPGIDCPDIVDFLRQIEFIDLTKIGAGSIEKVREKIRRTDRPGGKGPLVIVDTVDKIEVRPSRKSERMILEEICFQLSQLAEEESVPIWATTQANDSAHGAEVVDLKCLRDARGKGLPCSLVLGLGMTDKSRNLGIATLTADKHRDGRKFQVYLRTDLACQRFSSLTSAYEAF